jgi:hypothetical protein
VGLSFIIHVRLRCFLKDPLKNFYEIARQLDFRLGKMTSNKPVQRAEKPEVVSISPLLQRLAYPSTAEIRVSADDIASAFALIFEDRLSDIQTAALLTLLHSTGKDKDAAVIAKCSHRMREAACQIDKAALKKVVKARGIHEGNYKGGLVRNTLNASELHFADIRFLLV